MNVVCKYTKSALSKYQVQTFIVIMQVYLRRSSTRLLHAHYGPATLPHASLFQEDLAGQSDTIERNGFHEEPALI
jgi:hypothetical protein